LELEDSAGIFSSDPSGSTSSTSTSRFGASGNIEANLNLKED
jgi:hypothetical protein